MTRRTRRDIEKRIAELEEAAGDRIEDMTTSELYIASLEAGMPDGPEWPEALVDAIGEEYRQCVQGGGGADE